MPYINLEKVRYRSVITDLSLSIDESRVAIIGANGCGKSTLARIIAGLYECDSGTVSVHGINPMEDRDAAIQHIGIIFQNPDHQIIFPTVAEELAFGLKPLNLSKAEVEQRVHSMLERFSHADWGPRSVHEFSEGQRHLICLMSVLIMQPTTLIFDEPYTGLDLITTRRLHDLIAELEQNVIIISHDLERLQHYDRLIWLADGGVAADGTPDTVINRYRQYCEQQLAQSRPIPADTIQ